LYLTNCSNVDLFPNTKNQYWEINNKKIINLKTEHGNLKANQYIAAAGAWTNSITSQWGVVVPIEPVHGQMLLMQPPEDTDIKTIILSDGYYLIPRACGRIVIGSTMVMKGFCKRVDASTQNILLQQACKMVPSLSRGELIAQWSGLRPGMKSGIPWLGRLKNLRNAYIHAGHFRNGLVLAPASARLMRQILLKQKTTIDVHEYQPSNSHDLNQLEKEK
jgi:glycine oxidase